MIDFSQHAALPPLRAIDLQAGRLLARLDQDSSAVLPLLAALASWAVGQGHTCLPLAQAGKLLGDFGLDDTLWADIPALRNQLLRSKVVGEPGSVTPLILDQDNKLFLYRYDACEERIAQALSSRAQHLLPVDEPTALPLLERLFPQSGQNGMDWQRAAAVLALYKSLVIISGGPGTGKTYTVARILALLTGLATEKLRIALVAPTGKAALRLQESIQQAREGLADVPQAVFALQAQTLHRLLGFQLNRPGFRHNRTNPLHLDLLVVDEASMIDVGLMAALLEALPPRCRIILLGDRDQLASVEAGNLFGDLCGQDAIDWSDSLVKTLQPLLASAITPAATASPNLLADSLVLLRTSRRFASGSGIGALAQAINSGESEPVRQVLAASWADVDFFDVTKEQTPPIRERLLSFLSLLFSADSPQSALEALGERRILCALREGPHGVEGINRMVQMHLRRVRTIPPGRPYYPGMPILISRNDYQLGLFNGDTGVLWPDEQGLLCGWFEQEGGGLRCFSLARLPAWQPSYAMTVHKSQGSEFNQLLLLLPQEDAPVLTRELLYTGITRAKRRLTICGPLELLLRTTSRQVIRYSGLARKLDRFVII
ncbi:MAG: exodeoxyribonuclease V subunit alpha [Desulfobulbus sp.]|nr:exodeoxyribonuclease V subunit alpha [Desulfobulbus sp.]